MAPNGTNFEPTDQQRALIVVLSTFPYPRLVQAARRCKVPLDTAKKWHAQPGFKEAVRDAIDQDQREFRGRIQDKLYGLADKALAAKDANLEDKSGYVRHMESSWVLERLLGKLTEKRELTGKDGAAVEIDIVTRLEALWDKPLSDNLPAPSPDTSSA